MLHCSQEASTGWTRNSWVWSRVKTRRAFPNEGTGRATGNGRGTPPTLREYQAVGRRAQRAMSAPRASRGGVARARVPRARSVQVDAAREAQLRCLEPGTGARAGTGASVSPTEIAFLALGLLLGTAV